MADVLDSLRENGVYFIVQAGKGAGVSYAVVELDQGWFMYAFSSAAKARRLAREVDGVVHWHPELQEVFAALPPDVVGLVLDVDPESGEGWLLRADDLQRGG